MRELSHEIGRKQVRGVIQMLVRQDRKGVHVVEIGSGYTTARTAYLASPPHSPMVYYDAVVAFRYKPSRETTCLIESKAGRATSTINKFPSHFEDFVAKAYCVLDAWKDDLLDHRPLFLFVVSAQFDSELLKGGRLQPDTTEASLKAKGIAVSTEKLRKLTEFVRVFVFEDWLEGLTG
jgi:hypothetical protein